LLCLCGNTVGTFRAGFELWIAHFINSKRISPRGTSLGAVVWL
jgi:hypothetical protein